MSYEHVSEEKRRSQTLRKFTREVEFRSIFCAPSPKFKILAIRNVLAHGKYTTKSYEHDFAKKCDGHKLCRKSRAKSSFDRIFAHRLRNSKYWHTQRISLWEFRSVFCAPSRKFEILAIPKVLMHGKSY
ncbi:hypothetical protein B296_00050078 [Ensete ventricosum]|uniref:Uncharacterized protein n=1 Tax=Ensete ventricosum TaxID=4639 RepID=A0A426YB11_ENSVE|nr:hypothetical protein B296_00050078 [Ensete ventricosum]